jgi:DNA-binding transcriptional MerR regulator
VGSAARNDAAECNLRALANVRFGIYIAGLRKSKLLLCEALLVCRNHPSSTYPNAWTKRRLSICGAKRENKKTMMKTALAGVDAGVDIAVAETDFNGKEFARIGEMASAFGVTLRALRFYEDKGLLSPHREGTTRLYTRRDRARLKLILLGRKIGFSLRDVKQMIDLYDPTGSNAKQLRTALEKSEKQLGRLQKQRAAIDEAISELENLMTAVRRMLAERSIAASNSNIR